MTNKINKCDGNHGGPRCADPECWNDAPVPPAGGEVEVLSYLYRHPTGEPWPRTYKDRQYGMTDWVETELVDRAHVTRLQAELKQLIMVEYECRLALKVANKNTRQVIEQRDDLQSKLDDEAANHVGTLAEVQRLQAELTKARECLNTLQSAVFLMIDNSGDADDPGDIAIMRHDFDKLCELVPEDWQGLDSNQSAPADKGQGEPVAWRYHDEAGSSTWFNGAPEQVNLEFVERRRGRIERSFAEQPAPVAVVMPKRIKHRAENPAGRISYIKGWNACLDEFARLNSEPKP